MPPTPSNSYELRNDNDLVRARQVVRKVAQELKFSIVDQTKIVTAASELARNALIYGGGGEMIVEILPAMPRAGLRLTFKDEGPGIPDLELAMTDGWTSGTGLGLGLTGSKRLMDEFDLESSPGKGTRVTITRWK